MDKTVTVIGGGPAGLAASIALAQIGFDVSVFDHNTPPIDKACGEGLMPNAIDALGALGIAIPAGTGQPFRGVAFSDGRHRAEAGFRTGPGLGLRRTALHELLRCRAEALGVNLHWNCREPLFRGFIIAADGLHSQTRDRLGLAATRYERRRFGFRQHYRIEPWSPYVEVLWGKGFQIYVTPVAAEQVGVAVLTRESNLRIDAAVESFPSLRDRLKAAAIVSTHRGSLTLHRRFRQVCSEEGALIGDASGSVDAITGEGLAISFRQALLLASAISTDDLAGYGQQHTRLLRIPSVMSRLLLLLQSHPALTGAAIRLLKNNPQLFGRLLSLHAETATRRGSPPSLLVDEEN